MNLDFPFHFDRRGRTATTDDNDHIRDLLEQILLTGPGERVNRPDFGSGLLQMVFAPNSPEIAATIQFAAQAAIQRWMGDLVSVQNLEITSQDSALRVTVQYTVKATGQPQTQTFVQGGAS